MLKLVVHIARLQATIATMSGIEQAVKLCREQIAREIDDLNYKGADTSPCLLLLSDD